MEKRNTTRVEYLSRLARIALTQEEAASLEKDLERILEYVSQLQEIDTEGVEPTYHVLPMVNIWRQDKVETSLTVEDALKNAPEKKENFFQVPRVI